MKNSKIHVAHDPLKVVATGYIETCTATQLQSEFTTRHHYAISWILNGQKGCNSADVLMPRAAEYPPIACIILASGSNGHKLAGNKSSAKRKNTNLSRQKKEGQALCPYLFSVHS